MSAKAIYLRWGGASSKMPYPSFLRCAIRGGGTLSSPIMLTSFRSWFRRSVWIITLITCSRRVHRDMRNHSLKPFAARLFSYLKVRTRGWSRTVTVPMFRAPKRPACRQGWFALEIQLHVINARRSMSWSQSLPLTINRHERPTAALLDTLCSFNTGFHIDSPAATSRSSRDRRRIPVTPLLAALDQTLIRGSAR